VTSGALTALAEVDVAAAIGPFGGAPIEWPTSELPGWLAAFQTLQAWEAWQVHGEWLANRMDTLGADVRSRFERASTVTADQAAQAARDVARIRLAVRERLGDRVLLLPSASSVAPPVNDPVGLDAVRQATMQLTCIAGIGGLPAVTIPVTTVDGLPAGACLVGPAGSDQALIALAAELGGG
jgi:Asp-tRNA(Asn)/Glu-tRNA(Gln) amidotransferase A subunit family amidase